jgi:hypothetical protein
MEDYEYLTLLSALGDAGLAAQIVNDLFPSASRTEQSAQRLMAARERIAKRILELRGTPIP